VLASVQRFAREVVVMSKSGRQGAALAAVLVSVSLVLVAAAPVVRPVASIAGEGVLLPWGAGPGEVGFRAARRDFPAAGVEAVAIGADGATWLLDRRNERVVRLVNGRFESFAVPADVVDLAIGADGVVAGFSALRSRVAVFEPSGVAIGELPVPASVTEVAGLSFGASRQVFVRTGYQETFLLGGPSVPQEESMVRASRREGAAFLPGGEGVAVQRAMDGVLSLVRTRTADRVVETGRVAVAKGALSGVVVGASGDVVCVKVEREASVRPFRVARSVTCVDAMTGRVVLDEVLPARGAFLPRHELAVGGSPARVVHVSPEKDGLRVRSWPLAAGVVR